MPEYYCITRSSLSPAPRSGSAMGRPAPPIGPPPPRRAAPPPRAIRCDESASDDRDLRIPPQYKTACAVGLALQALLDMLALLVVCYTGGAFFTIPVAGFCMALDGALLVWTIKASPLPIDVLMKNALSGVAWFMLCVINGVIISDTKNPYSFITCTFIMIYNLCFWLWTLWWGLNDRGPRTMFPRKSEKRCSACRAGGPVDKHSGPCCHSKDCESGFPMRPIALPPRAQLSVLHSTSTNNLHDGPLDRSPADEPSKGYEDDALNKPIASYDGLANHPPGHDGYVSRPDGYTPRPDSYVSRLSRGTSFASTGETERVLHPA